MNNSLEEILLAFFYTDKIFVSRFAAEKGIDWISTDYRKLISIIKEYYLKHGEVASTNIVAEGVTTQEDALFYKSAIEKAKSLIVERSDFPRLIEKFKERYNKELITRTVTNVKLGLDSGRGLNELNRHLNKTTTKIAELYRGHAYEEGTLKETAVDDFKRYVEEAKNPDVVKGKMTKLVELDRITNGLRPPDLLMVVGESGTGKSIMCMNIAINMWLGSNNVDEFCKDYEFKDDGCNVLYFSIEMDYENMKQRIDSNIAGIDFYGLRDRKLGKEDVMKYKRACVFKARYNKQFFVADIPRGITIMDIKAKYEELCNVFEPDIIVVDHLGLMRPVESKGADWLEQGDIAADLHEFNRRNKRITLTAVQANRAKAQNGKKHHGTNRVGRSEIIPQNASIILEIDHREDEETYSDMPIYITKMRNGEKGRFNLYKQFSIMRVVDEEGI
jgi:replicative DNA helicase